MITQEYIKRLFDYDPTTGWFLNRISRGYQAPIGKRAGSPTRRGRYRKIGIDGGDYYEHQLAWLYVYGELVLGVEHHNGDGQYNAISNLRKGSQSDNMANADKVIGECGYRGVSMDKGKYVARLQKNYQVFHLGTYDTVEEAAGAYINAAEKHFGEFAFHNRPIPSASGG